MRTFQRFNNYLNSNSTIIHGYKARIIRVGIKLTILKLSVKEFINPIIAFKVLRQLINKKQKIIGNASNPRFIKSGSKYYWTTDFPGWPSKTFNIYIKKEFYRVRSEKQNNKLVQTIIFAITNRCHLRCEHCFEWDRLDSVDKLNINELKHILIKIQNQAIYHIQLSGGEPLVRFDEMIQLINSANIGTNFWLLTSGYGLTNEKAAILKQAGLIGVNISLDHWNEDHHNEFRNNNTSFKWVKEAVINCKNNGLIISLSLCATKQFITEDNLWKYLQLAKDWKVDFIRILEPRTAGRYSNKDVELEYSHWHILEKFYLRINSDGKYFDYPILVYPGDHQRKVGCFGAGNRYFYVDSNADIHACPFCLRKQGNALNDASFEPALLKMKETKCHAFKMNYTD
jgi:MoaA/NifB/PqqE/SkfB family radical SAM enzyme